jgi:hypothetical protein
MTDIYVVQPQPTQAEIDNIQKANQEASEARAEARAQRVAQRLAASAAILERLDSKPKLSIRKSDKDELQSLIEFEKVAYANRVSGHTEDYNSPMDSNGHWAKTYLHGAIEVTVEKSLVIAMDKLKGLIAEGHEIVITSTHCPTTDSHGVTTIYTLKPVAQQEEEIKLVVEQVTKAYAASIEAHNEKVFEQERAVMLIEEAQAREAIKREDAAKAEAEIEKRVQARIRGMRAGK